MVTTKKWYESVICQEHIGEGYRYRRVFVFKESPQDAVEELRHLTCSKRGLHPNIETSDVRELSLEESVKLERKIIMDGRVDLRRAKRGWYYSN